jgi:hypothetical protein
MSGQPYRYITDVDKFRNEYMDSLRLRSQLDDINLEANMNYKQTGVLPPSSAMRDTRTVEQKLSDFEMLKTDLSQAIASLSSRQFGTLVVQTILSSPLNVDNKLLVFAAQRVDDILKNLKKIYKYGIRGDVNDALQLVTFLERMYSDTSSITASTKDFMNRYSERTAGMNQYDALKSALVRFDVFLRTYQTSLVECKKMLKSNVLDPSLTSSIVTIIKNINTILEYIKKLTSSYLLQMDTITYIENIITQNILPKKEYKAALEYLEFINTGLPLASSIQTITDRLTKSQDNIRQLTKSLGSAGELRVSFRADYPQLYNSLVTTLRTSSELINSTSSIIRPRLDKYNDTDLVYIMGMLLYLTEYPSQSQWEQASTASDEPRSSIPGSSASHAQPTSPESRRQLEALELINSKIEEGHSPEVIRAYILSPSISYSINYPYLVKAFNQVFSVDEDVEPIQGQGIKRKSRKVPRMKGRGLGTDTASVEQQSARPLDKSDRGFDKISKAKTFDKSKAKASYSDFVKSNIDSTVGIDPSPRFVKLGRYLINRNKLNNGIMSVKLPSGGSIGGIPAIRISNNLKDIFSKIIGGNIPAYDDINKLTEPEKQYLYTVAKKSNILDKFTIPTPSKDQQEKDIHKFEVLRGQIMAGNDNKDLIKEFKLLVVKLSKSGDLPKKEASDILEELVLLGY